MKVIIFFFFSAFLKKKLDIYVDRHLPKVKIIRLPERMGLIRARLAGAKKAKAQVLLFLDSHTEANVNWLPPLLGKFFKHKYQYFHRINILTFSYNF